MMSHVQFSRKESNKNWVKFEEGKSKDPQREQCRHSDSEPMSSQIGKQLKNKDNPNKQIGPNPRRIFNGDDEIDCQFIEKDNINLISCEINEEKNSQLVSGIIYANEDSDGFLEYHNKQVCTEEGPEKHPRKALDPTQLQSTPFDSAPGFGVARRSPRQKKTKTKKARIDETHEYIKRPEQLDLSQSFENDFSADEGNDSSWVTLSQFLASNQSTKDSSEFEATESFAHLESSGKESIAVTPKMNRNWVSFENEGIANKAVVKKHYEPNELKRKKDMEDIEYQSQMSSSMASPRSNSSSAILSGIQISDVYDIPDDISLEFKNRPTLICLDADSPVRAESISNECSARNVQHGMRKDEIEDFDTDSNFSGEVYDLNNIENDSLLQDTRKPFPKEGIFQASSTKQEIKQEPEESSEITKKPPCQDLSLEDNNATPLDDFPMLSARTEWAFMYRYPDKKRKFVSRKWLNVKAMVKDDAIKITGRLDNADMIKEIPLHPFFVFTMPVLHNNDGHNKVHSVKLQYVKYKETRKVASKFQLEHIPSYTPVLKLASKDCRSMKEFIDAVENVVRKIETHRDKGITHRHEEIFIDCDDICQYELDGDGTVKQYSITCQIRLRAFITGIPNLYLFLNDIMSYNKQKNQRVNRKQPKSNRWIKLENIEYHPSVDVSLTNSEGGIVFKPPDACSFELMRFRVRNTKELPTIFKASIDFTTSKSFQIKAECKIGGEGRMMKYRRNNIVVRFPIPTTWTSVFVKSRSFSGKKKYVQARADNKTFASGIGRTARCYIEVSTGNAKYEPEYGSVVWRIGDLPILASGVPADAVQTFDCQVNLPFEIDLPKTQDLYAEVEYEIPHAVGSEIQVQEVLLSDGRTPDKWVCYRALYYYKVLMNVINQQRLGYL